MTEESRARALDAAYRILARRDAFTTEVRQRLELRGFCEPAIEAAIRRLTERGLLDDEALARKLVASRPVDRPFGRLRWRFDLAKRGLSEETIERVLRDLSEAEETRRLTEALRRRYPSTRDRAKAARYAVSQGFDEEVIREALDQVFGPEPDPL